MIRLFVKRVYRKPKGVYASFCTVFTVDFGPYSAKMHALVDKGKGKNKNFSFEGVALPIS